MEYKRLSKEELDKELQNLKGWSIVNGKLSKEFKFKDFNHAISFLVRVAMEAEKLNHHPELFNVYNKVKIELVTHDINAISNYDVMLAHNIEKRV